MRAKAFLASIVSFSMLLATVSTVLAGKDSDRTAIPERQGFAEPDVDRKELQPAPVAKDPGPVPPAAVKKQTPSISNPGSPGSPGRLDPAPNMEPQPGTADQAPLNARTLDEIKAGLRGHRGMGHNALDELPGDDRGGTPPWDASGGIDPTDLSTLPGMNEENDAMVMPGDVSGSGGDKGFAPPEIRDTSNWDRSGSAGSGPSAGSGDGNSAYDICMAHGGGASCDGLSTDPDSGHAYCVALGGGPACDAGSQPGASFGGVDTPYSEDDNLYNEVGPGDIAGPKHGDADGDGIQDGSDTPGKSASDDPEPQIDDGRQGPVTYYGEEGQVRCEGDLGDPGNCRQYVPGSGSHDSGTPSFGLDSQPAPELDTPGTTGDPEGPPRIATGDVDPPQETEQSGSGGLVSTQHDVDYDENSVSPSGATQIRLLHGEVDPVPPDGN